MNEYQLSSTEYDNDALKLLDKLFPHLEGDFMLDEVIKTVIIDEEERNHSYRLSSKMQKLMIDRFEYAIHSKGYKLKLTEIGKAVKNKGGHFKVNPIPLQANFKDEKKPSSYFNEISAVNKDSILLLLNEKLAPSNYYHLNQDELSKSLNLSIYSIDTILNQFMRLGFIEYDGMIEGDFPILIKAEMYDFIRRGGFVVQEELIVHQLTSVLEEMKKLNGLESKDIFSKIEKMSGVMANIITIIKSGINGSSET